MSFRQSGVTLMTAGVSMPPWDAFTLTLSAGDTTETYKFYRDGQPADGGIFVAQWVLVYTDSSRAVLSTGTFTDLSPSS